MADPQTLQTLVDEGRVDELLGLVPVGTVTETWLRYHGVEQHADDSDDDPDWWAVELWMSPAWWSDEQRVREGLLRLIEAADDDALSVVAAGPLEVFLRADPSRLQWIERQARRSEKFRRALAQVRVWELPSGAFARLERAAGISTCTPRSLSRPELPSNWSEMPVGIGPCTPPSGPYRRRRWVGSRRQRGQT